MPNNEQSKPTAMPRTILPASHSNIPTPSGTSCGHKRGKVPEVQNILENTLRRSASTDSIYDKPWPSMDEIMCNVSELLQGGTTNVSYAKPKMSRNSVGDSGRFTMDEQQVTHGKSSVKTTTPTPSIPSSSPPRPDRSPAGSDDWNNETVVLSKINRSRYRIIRDEVQQFIHTLQQNSLIMPISAIMSFYFATGLVYWHNPEMFKIFLKKNIIGCVFESANITHYHTIGAAIMPFILFLPLIGYLTYRTAKNTQEHTVYRGSYNCIIKEIFALHCRYYKSHIQCIRAEYVNNTIIEVPLNLYQQDYPGIACADSGVTHKTNSLKLLMKRPLFVCLLTTFIILNIVLNLELYITDNNVNLFYQNIFSMNISTVALSLVLLNAITLVTFGFHYYDKHGYYNVSLMAKPEDINNAEKCNALIRDAMLQCKERPTLLERALEPAHKQQGKRCNLALTKLTITPCGLSSDVVYNIG